MSLLNLILGGVQLIAGIVLTATGVGGGIGLKLILSGALSLISSFMSAQSGRDGVTSSSTYGFDNLSNAAREGGPVPVGYGRHIFTPPCINLNVIQDGETQTLYMLLLLGEGEIDSIEKVYLNGTDSEKFPGVDVSEWRAGTDAQTICPKFSQVGTGYDAGTRMTKDTQHVHDMRQSCNELALQFVWPAGFYKNKPSGGIDVENVVLKVEYAVYGTTNWKPFPAPSNAAPTATNPWSSWNNAEAMFIISGTTTAAARRTLRLAFDGVSGRPAAGRYSVRVTGQNDDSGGHVRVPTLASIIEIQSLSLTYPNRALLSVKIPAIEQLGTSLPRVSVVGKWRKVYDPRTSTTTWSDNPALCVRDLLVNDRYGLGQWITSDMIDDGVGGSWRTVADACDALVTVPGMNGTTRKRFVMGYMLDVKNPATDYLTEMLQVFRATLFASDGAVRISMDVPGSSIRSFEDRATAAVALRRGIRHEVGETGYGDRSLLTAHVLEDSQRWNVVRVHHIDAERDWSHRTLELRNKFIAVTGGSGTFTTGETVKVGSTKTCRFIFERGGYLFFVQDENATALASGESMVGQTSGATRTTSGSPVTRESPERAVEVNLFGCTNRAQAICEMRYHLNRALMTPIFAQLPVGAGDIDLIPGDVVDVSSDYPAAWSAKAFSVLSLGFDQNGEGVVTAREYNASVYVDAVDTAATDITGATAGGTGTTATPSIPGDLTFGSIGSSNGGSTGFGAPSSATAVLGIGDVVITWSGFYGSKK